MKKLSWRKVDWNKELPEIPLSVHNKVVETLSSLEHVEVVNLENVSREENQECRKHRTIRKKRLAIVIVAITTLLGTTVVAADYIMQKNVIFVEDEEELAKYSKEETVSMEEYAGENLDLETCQVHDWSEDWITNAEGKVESVLGTANNRWTKKITHVCEDTLWVGYVYPSLAEAFKDHNIEIDLDYIENQYPMLWGEKACQYYYKTEEERELQNYVYFGGYKNEHSQYIFLQYEYNPNYINKDAYKVAGNDEDISNFKTNDGVNLSITSRKSEGGYEITYAELITEHGMLQITLRGIFTQEEQDAIYNSLNLANICRKE